MTTRPWTDNERLVDLMAERAIHGLSPEQAAELEALAAEHGLHGDELDYPVASLDVLFVESDLDVQAPPDDVVASLLELGSRVAGELKKAEAQDAGDSDANPGHGAPGAGPDAPGLRLAGTPAEPANAPTRAGPVAWGGWLAAAACLVVAAIAWWPGGAEQAPVVLSLAEQVEQMRNLPTAVTASWAGLDDLGLTETPHAYDNQLAGEVVWDEATDTGYMIFTGLASNNPTELQYQLWIFDAERRIGDLPEFAVEGFPPILTQRPVDGGVFNSVDGTVIVPIDAKLPIGQAALFAVTVEPPGGVVVSDRDIVTAALPG
ncbi:MAG: anti-sigma factor domain-containing protein [Phycisphaerales bacterium JB040]